LRRAGLFRHIIIDLRFVTLIVIVSITAMICVYTRAASKEPGEETATQTRSARPPQQSRRRRPPAARQRVDYSNFSHATKGHFENCSSCHLIPSFEKPDIADYPDHPACINCHRHRQQFFRGARPVICSNCHTVTSPRSEARFKFPKDNEASQFSDIFPHSNHVKTTMLLQFKRLEGGGNLQATCNYCHKEMTDKLPADAPKDTAVRATFMTTPTSHVTCFGCHWQKGVENREQPPLAMECSGCHKNLAKPVLQTAALTTALAASPAKASAPRIIPATAQGTLVAHKTLTPDRISPKFVHVLNQKDLEADPHRRKTNDDGKRVNITCLQCHTAARKAGTLEAMRLEVNRVQLMPSCSTSACHTALSGLAQLKLSVFRELRERSKDAKFDCALCHTPPVSLNAEVPCSHYNAVRDSAKKENEALEKAGKKARSLTGIEGLIPPRCAEAPKKEGS